MNDKEEQIATAWAKYQQAVKQYRKGCLAVEELNAQQKEALLTIKDAAIELLTFF